MFKECLHCRQFWFFFFFFSSIISLSYPYLCVSPPLFYVVRFILIFLSLIFYAEFLLQIMHNDEFVYTFYDVSLSRTSRSQTFFHTLSISGSFHSCVFHLWMMMLVADFDRKFLLLLNR